MERSTIEELISDVRRILPGIRLFENEPMAAHCSFRTGGPVRVLALPQCEEDLLSLCGLLKEKQIRPLLLGNGTNMVFPDQGCSRFVIGTDGLQELRLLPDGRIYASAGVPLSRLAAFACENALTGLEFASGIPGSVGGGLLMNAGAYGGEMKDVTEEVFVYAPEEEQVRRIENRDCAFAYRQSRFQKEESILLGAIFHLISGQKDAVSEKMRELNRRRREKQPLDMPSAGSAFRRPEGYYAAALIEECGLKGFSSGGAQVSPKHAGFIVNTGNATTEDLRRLLEYVRTEVYRQKNILLEPEVILVPSDS